MSQVATLKNNPTTRFYQPNNNLVSHVAMIQNIPNPEQIQYLTFTHCVAWSFNKVEKCKIILLILITFYNKTIIINIYIYS